MRVLTVIPLSAAVGAIVAVLPAGLLIGSAPRTQTHSNPCRPPIGAVAAACADSEPQEGPGQRPLPAGDAPAFLFASVQPIKAPESWRTIYREVERCAGMVGDYEQIRWAVMDAPLQGPTGPTYGSTWAAGSSWCATTRPISGMRCCTTFSRQRDGSRVRSNPASTTPSRTYIRCRCSGCAREGGEAAA
jgi:hypothetical protein